MNMFKPTTAKTPEEYIELITDPERKAQILELHNFIKKLVPDLKPFIMSGMISYGHYHYKSKTREGEWMVIALASQKNYISVYACAAENGKYVPETYSKKLPKASIGRSCIRFKKIEDIDLDVLKEILLKSVKILKPEN